ncbi:hypothetical protein M3Y99_00935300 [Aphelenchoides fujianensis]|nr:hypothetical protein M3Y99_00935300 [Aphelenchoides fujianensis]
MTEMRLLAVLFVCAVLPLVAHSAIHAPAGLPPVDEAAVAANTTAPPSESELDRAYRQGFEAGRKQGADDRLDETFLKSYMDGMRQGFQWGNQTGYANGWLKGFDVGEMFGKTANKVEGNERAASDAAPVLIFLIVLMLFVLCCIGVYKCRHGFIIEHKGVPVFEFPKEAAKNGY